MEKLKLPFLLVLSLFTVSIAQQHQSSTDNKGPTGDKLLECSDLTDLSEMSLCLSKRFAEVKKKTTTRNYGYPFQMAPPLPPFLIAEGPQNSIAGYGKRRSNQEERRTRMQGYNEPQYRNFLDLDTTLRPRVAEYRPVFDDYAVPVLIYPEFRDQYPKAPQNNYYLKPVKPTGQTTRYPKKVYGHRPGYYNRYNTRPQQDYNDPKDIKHHPEYQPQRPKQKNYDRDYYVPANSPIMGDIRRSLLDYTGAADLMEEEPEYVLKSHRIKEMSYDFYPFRTSFLADLEVNESKTRSSKKANDTESGKSH